MTPARARRPQVPMARRRVELAEAAVQVMRREGAWTVTTRAVAAEAGVPHGSVHYAFSSKHELLKAVFAADVEGATRVFSTVDLEGGATQVLARACQAYADRLTADPETELVLQELSLMGARDPELREIVQESTATYRRLVTDLLTGVTDREGGRWDAPVELVAEQVLGVLFGSAASWLVGRDDDLLRATLSDLAALTASRWGPG